MKCPRCGNEIQPGDVFCGQCGAPSNPQGLPLEKDNARLTQSGGIPALYKNSMPLQSPVPNASSQLPLSPPSAYKQTPGPVYTDHPLRAGQSNSSISGQNQQSSFYHGATEAFVTPPGKSTSPQQQSYLSDSAPRNFPQSQLLGSAPTPPVQIGNPDMRVPYAPVSYFHANDQGSRPSSAVVPPRRKQQHSAIVPIIGICLAIAIISIIGLMTVIFAKPHVDIIVPTPAAIDQATIVPTATALPTATPDPTVAPDAGFAWCTVLCINNNFSMQYPVTWNASATTTTNGVQFVYPAETDILMVVKVPGPDSGNATAGQLLNADLQTNYATQPGYIAPTTTQTATLGGETWEVGIAYYQGTTNVRERLIVYITVHQGNIYIIEMQAPDTLFDSINSSYYMFMLHRFSFQQ